MAARSNEKNARYWAQREAEMENLAKQEEMIQSYNRRVAAIYARMYQEAQKEIDAFYGRYATQEGISINEAKKRVDKMDVRAFEEQAKRLVAERDFSKEANERLRLYNLTMKVNRLEYLKAQMGWKLVEGFDAVGKDTASTLNQAAVDEFRRQAGILGLTLDREIHDAEAIVNASFQNARFSDRIWMYHDALRDELSKALTTGLIQGKSRVELARQVQKRFGSSRYNTERLIRTEMARVQTEAQIQSFNRGGFTHYIYIARETACDICKPLDGKVFSVNDVQIATNAPPMHPHCFCSLAAATDEQISNKGYLSELTQPKIDSVDQCNTFDELDDYFTRTYEIDMDEEVKKLHFESVREALSGVEHVFRKFDGVSESMKKIDVNNHGVMSCGAGAISFNPFYFTGKEKLDDGIMRSVQTGWWPKNSSRASIGAHEAGHAVNWRILEGMYDYRFQAVLDWNEGITAKKIVQISTKEVKAAMPKGTKKKVSDIRKEQSGYGATDPSEAWAEAFADIEANGDNSHELSKTIMRRVKEMWEELDHD